MGCRKTRFAKGQFAVSLGGLPSPQTTAPRRVKSKGVLDAALAKSIGDFASLVRKSYSNDSSRVSSVVLVSDRFATFERVECPGFPRSLCSLRKRATLEAAKRMTTMILEPPRKTKLGVGLDT